MLGVYEDTRYCVLEFMPGVMIGPLICHGSMFTNWITFLAHFTFKSCDWQADKICHYRVRKKSASTFYLVVVTGECKFTTVSKMYTMKAWG